MPGTTAGDASAALEVDGTTVALTPTADRAFKSGVGAKFDDRQVNSIFELSTD